MCVIKVQSYLLKLKKVYFYSLNLFLKKLPIYLIESQIASLRWPNVGLWLQGWLHIYVGSTALNQHYIYHYWSTGIVQLLDLRSSSNVGIWTLFHLWANIKLISVAMNTLYRCRVF